MDWPQAILLDFYGTVVKEDDPVIASVRQAIYASATANEPAVLNVGDSLTADVNGANALGIPVAWMNRERKSIPPRSHMHYEALDLESIAQAVAHRR